MSAVKAVKAVKIVEVGPRDGLQNETRILTPSQRVELIRQLGQAGLRTIEAGSFVSPIWVPQMANTAEVLAQLAEAEAESAEPIAYPVLTPNLQGYQAAVAAGAREIAIFGSASESFSEKNINCSIAESLARFQIVTERARVDGIRVRGYVSCVIACPYEGVIAPEPVAEVVDRLLEMGCYEISLGDTIGRGTPKSIAALLDRLLATAASDQLALHCHDTYGTAVANIMQALGQGIRTFDASIGGAGGCPYAVGASGNVATEEVCFLLQQEGWDTGLDLSRLVQTGQWLYQQLGKPVVSRVNQALAGN
ncbi:hydroxymethylglutaryl-CoA lyase [Reinekea sp.]|jgi:hydroxymethylglutaryl-CoA lyase|uniref:hydroxymethylglutaryl-CoA lyase n=1 Tax=Reinekea sp. TaxID=1970455 RepID=UPI002A819571|nr:hydroxymethylglutaryl-CoA lyase [Reinekea sp.]